MARSDAVARFLVFDCFAPLMVKVPRTESRMVMRVGA